MAYEDVLLAMSGLLLIETKIGQGGSESGGSTKLEVALDAGAYASVSTDANLVLSCSHPGPA